MPTFVFNNSAASNSGVILLEVPDLSWFNDSVLSALAEMTIPDNWRGDDEDYRKYALLQANLMMATYKVLNFNPFPVGMIVPFANHIAPPGYLLCDAASYTRLEYPELYAAIDEIYIIDEDNFIVPDMTNCAVFNVGDLFEFGESAGQHRVLLHINEIPVHNHPDSGHVHTIPLTTTSLVVAPGELPVVVPIPLATDFTGTDFANVTDAGGGEYHNNMPPYIALNYCIYAGR